jgi:GT2 family glycosyltransferase
LSIEVIVVDNSHTVGATGVLRTFPDVRLVESRTNVGFARACNRGMAFARAPRILLLNPDTVVDAGAIATLARHLDRNPGVGAVGPRLLNPDGTLQFSCRRFPRPWSIFFGRYALLTRFFPGNRLSREYLYSDWDHRETRAVDWVSGACVMVRRETLERVGPLDDGYFLFVEDMDWCRRIRAADLDVTYLPEATVMHHIGASRGPVTARIAWERHRSMFRYVDKHFGWPGLLVGLAALGLFARGALMVTLDAVRSAYGPPAVIPAAEEPWPESAPRPAAGEPARPAMVTPGTRAR